MPKKFHLHPYPKKCGVWKSLFKFIYLLQIYLFLCQSMIHPINLDWFFLCLSWFFFMFYMVSCSHELMQHAFSCCSLENNCSHKSHIQMDSFSHEQLQHVGSCYLYENNYYHELMQHAYSCAAFENKPNHISHI